MKKYQTILILTLLLSCTLIGCGKQDTPTAPQETEATKTEQTNEAVTYEVITEIFQENEITIHYPQIEKLADRAAEDKINGIIKENALIEYNEFLKQEENVTYELNYTLTYSSPDLLSVRYDGYLSFPGAAHPNQFIDTININIKDQKIVRLRDGFNINEGFVKLVQNGKYQSPDTEQTQELWEAIQNQWKEREVSGWIEYFKNADVRDMNHETAASYFTEDGLVIAIPVPHAIGDYAEFALSDNDLADYQIAAMKG